MARRPGGEAEIRARLAASPGLDDREAHTFAGLVDAESHLGIVPNNCGSGWRCVCSVGLRDDDQEILLNYRQKLGLGHLAAVPARNTSRPQVHWQIASKVECRVLAELLDAHPLRGRKLREYEIWREAIMVWTSRRQGFGPGGRARLAQLAAYIRAERVYRDPPPDAARPNMTDQHAADYFAGFFSGEGCFQLAQRQARLTIKLRRDDRPLLEAFCHAFGIGSVVNVPAQEPAAPAAAWTVTGARDVLTAIGLFDSAPLLGRKARQYEAWRLAAKAIAEAVIHKSALDKGFIEQARLEFRHASSYRPPGLPLQIDDGSADACAAYLEVLRQWSASADGPLSCTRYSAARRYEHPEWPQRNTIAEAFGSWYDALAAAGLTARAASDRSSRPPRFRLDRLDGADAAYRAAVVRRLRGLLRSPCPT
jgi:LAGLIDADG DNA endonuclease family protein